MNHVSETKTHTYPQQAIWAKYLHLSGSFIEFKREEIEQSIPQRFEKIVRQYPCRVAIQGDDHRLTYEQLNCLANRVAHVLLDRLGGNEAPVALLLPHGISAVVALLGTLKAAKCYVPLDPGYSGNRLAEILKESQSSLLLTDDAHLSLALGFVGDTSTVLNIDNVDAKFSSDDPSLPISSRSLAYLFYTSGSTGRPKGVTQSHRNVLHQIMTYTNGLMINPDDRVTQLHSHGFSASRLDIFGALLNGATLFPFSVAGEGMRGLARGLIDKAITIMHWVPTAFRYFAGTLDKGEQFPDMRLIVLGSESLTSRDVELYRRYFSPDSVLVNRYGATETGNIRWHFLDQQTTLRTRPVPVGYAIEDTEVLLLDEMGKEVEENQIGEIAVKSPYLSPGYWQRPDLTAEAFSAAPGEPGKSIYRTGDMGQLLEDGCLIHLGRKDFQTKIRGYRVEPGEVERALLEYPAITTAAVVVRQDKRQDNHLVAYYVTGKMRALDLSELRSHLRSRLPSYMVPTAFVRLDALPLTPNGKLDRSALPEPDQLKLGGEIPAAELRTVVEKVLPAPDQSRPKLEDSFVPPRTPTEEMIAGIWAELLHVEQVGMHDNFFDLGGHSLLATQISSKVLKILQVELPMRSIFEAPTVAGLAKLIETIGWTRQGQQLPIESKGEREQGNI